MRFSTVAILIAFVIPAWASSPGQPLDCSDWSVGVGMTCTVLVSDCGTEPTTGNPDFPCANVAGSGIDATGNLVGIEYLEPGPLYCGYQFGHPSLELTSFDGTSEQRLGAIYWRCVDEVTQCDDRITPLARGFDTVNGRLLVWFRSWNQNCPATYDKHWLAAFEGFATTAEVLQTYTPTTSQISFRVPNMPEGFRYADYFDTYWGDLATVGDWSRAQPLQCGYPATAPTAGDYLTVEDTLPTPAPGSGYYYVTSVNYQGQRRYGRRANGGVLSGRDSAVLPACSE